MLRDFKAAAQDLNRVTTGCECRVPVLRNTSVLGTRLLALFLWNPYLPLSQSHHPDGLYCFSSAGPGGVQVKRSADVRKNTRLIRVWAVGFDDSSRTGIALGSERRRQYLAQLFSTCAEYAPRTANSKIRSSRCVWNRSPERGRGASLIAFKLSWPSRSNSSPDCPSAR